MTVIGGYGHRSARFEWFQYTYTIYHISQSRTKFFLEERVDYVELVLMNIASFKYY